MQILARARIRKSQVYLTPALLSDHLLNTVGSMNVQRPNNTMAINWLVPGSALYLSLFYRGNFLELLSQTAARQADGTCQMQLIKNILKLVLREEKSITLL